MKSFAQLSFASSEMVNNTTDVKGGNNAKTTSFGIKRPVIVVTFPATATTVTKPTLGRRHH